MKYIIAGTDRPGSSTLKLSKYIQGIYKSLGEDVEIIDLLEVKEHLHTGPHYGKDEPGIRPYLDKIAQSDGLIMVCPEYNGSLPGVLKYFIDHWRFPESFEYRPVCFVGLSAGMFGGLRPVEHLQQIFSYRNAFMFPERVFIMASHKVINADGEVQDEAIKALLLQQAKNFGKFTKALSSAKLDANSVIELKKKA
ncbi:NADPH-dependent FMN reductase [Bdellovibrio svalbardensis]|uniref:NAD(P)H-dependent oxidoreductase n=1 Tax=Bdellovibrio svalbardensis TaxID=2972972 RepID=A0ABT6DIF5_9BACT|nr:NAD(P)H-dependent oxidoreductase [Bdellovibrio svalbardensis]MDG0816612.1 NAD(P)H-dependent oxidoreductase [Bdellovibrio svalbardensis]